MQCVRGSFFAHFFRNAAAFSLFMERWQRGKPQQPSGIFGGLLSENCKPRISNFQHTYIFLDIQQKKLGKAQPSRRKFFGLQTGPILSIPGLTQQNLCHFVALATIKRISWQPLPPTSHHIPHRPKVNQQNNGFVAFGLHCASFRVRLKI